MDRAGSGGPSRRIPICRRRGRGRASSNFNPLRAVCARIVEGEGEEDDDDEEEEGEGEGARVRKAEGARQLNLYYAIRLLEARIEFAKLWPNLSIESKAI